MLKPSVSLEISTKGRKMTVMRMDGGAWGCSGIVNIIVISIMIVLSFKR